MVTKTIKLYNFSDRVHMEMGQAGSYIVGKVHEQETHCHIFQSTLEPEE